MENIHVNLEQKSYWFKNRKHCQKILYGSLEIPHTQTLFVLQLLVLKNLRSMAWFALNTNLCFVKSNQPCFVWTCKSMQWKNCGLFPPTEHHVKPCLCWLTLFVLIIVYHYVQTKQSCLTIVCLAIPSLLALLLAHGLQNKLQISVIWVCSISFPFSLLPSRCFGLQPLLVPASTTCHGEGYFAG